MEQPGGPIQLGTFRYSPRAALCCGGVNELHGDFSGNLLEEDCNCLQ